MEKNNEINILSKLENLEQQIFLLEEKLKNYIKKVESLQAENKKLQQNIHLLESENKKLQGYYKEYLQLCSKTNLVKQKIKKLVDKLAYNI
ncbi:MAG: hypothetical protein NZ839_02110 [Endomicrobia bacterium]|nr:hypothetical protein [Endomicrobiia bacterium]